VEVPAYLLDPPAVSWHGKLLIPGQWSRGLQIWPDHHYREWRDTGFPPGGPDLFRFHPWVTDRSRCGNTSSVDAGKDCRPTSPYCESVGWRLRAEFLPERDSPSRCSHCRQGRRVS